MTFLSQIVSLTHGNSLRLNKALPEATNGVTLGTNAPDALLGIFIK